MNECIRPCTYTQVCLLACVYVAGYFYSAYQEPLKNASMTSILHSLCMHIYIYFYVYIYIYIYIYVYVYTWRAMGHIYVKRYHRRYSLQGNGCHTKQLLIAPSPK